MKKYFDAKNYKGGVPTGPDIKKLCNEYGIPKEGTFISYESISDLLKINKNNSRFTTVMNKWRDYLRFEHNVFIYVLRGRGYIVGDPSDRIKESSKHIRGIGRRLAQSIVANNIPTKRLVELSEEDRKTHEQNRVINTKIGGEVLQYNILNTKKTSALLERNK